MIQSLLFDGKEFNFPSHFMAIVGDNGSGKSRFLQALWKSRSDKAGEAVEYVGEVFLCFGNGLPKAMYPGSNIIARSDRLLEAFSSAIVSGVKECDRVEYDLLENKFVFSIRNKLIPEHELSGGFSLIIRTFGCIACCAAILDSTGKRTNQEATGLVLIDEIETHLHPKWQRTIVGDLRRVFPKIQFAVTTNSPFIIQSLREEELINLDDPEVWSEYSDRSIEDIAESVMGVEMPQKSKRYLNMMAAAEEYYRVLEEAKSTPESEIKRLRERLDELSIPYSDDPAFHAFLKMERASALREGN